jgi:hypothetical protein
MKSDNELHICQFCLERLTPMTFGNSINNNVYYYACANKRCVEAIEKSEINDCLFSGDCIIRIHEVPYPDEFDEFLRDNFFDLLA